MFTRQFGLAGSKEENAAEKAAVWHLFCSVYHFRTACGI
jgi:hypothetical protein